MNRPYIKICGLRDIATAEKAVQLGAHFIGLIFHPASIRNVVVENAKSIATAVKNAGGIPVAVFVEQDANAMIDICEKTGITTVQLHGVTAKQYHHLLPQHFTRIYVIGCNQDASYHESIPFSTLDKEKDFLLFDYLNPGSGEIFNWQLFKTIENFRWFLAGGLNKKNIQQAIDILKPTGIDVSSGVEIDKGTKHLPYIKEFIETVNHSKARHL